MKLLVTTLILFGLSEGAWSKDLNASLSNSSFAESRHESLSAADLIMSDGIAAAVSNPAYTGGGFKGVKKENFRMFYFPYVATNTLITENSASSSLLTAFSFSNDFADELTGDDQPSYSRISLVPAIGFSRVIIAPIYDIQTSLSQWDSDGSYNVARQENMGINLSFSMHNDARSFFFGGKMSWLNQSRLTANTSLATLQDGDLFKTFKSENTSSYEAYTAALGLGYVYKHKLAPSVALVVEDLGVSLYNLKSSEDPNAKSYMVEENLKLAFGISPNIGTSFGHFNYVLQFDHLSNPDVEFSDKIKTSLDLNLGPRFADASLGYLSIGYSSKGASGGLGLKFLFFDLRAAMYPSEFRSADGKEKESHYTQSITASVDLSKGI